MWLAWIALGAGIALSAWFLVILCMPDDPDKGEAFGHGRHAMMWMWDEKSEFEGQTVMLWRAYAEVLAEGIEYWLASTTPVETPSESAERLADYNDVREGKMSFKTYADKWMPYLEKPLCKPR